MKISIDRGDHSENGLKGKDKDKVEKTTSIEGINHPKTTIMTNLVADLIIKAVGSAITPEIKTKDLNVVILQTAVSSAIDVEKKVI